MRSHLQNVKLGSLGFGAKGAEGDPKPQMSNMGMWSRVLAACACISALTGCIIVDSNSTTTTNTNTNTNTPPPVDPMTMTIDSDVALDAKPGDGVGIFVEYTTGGRYRIWTTCDTNTSGVTCPYDIYTSVDTSSNIVAVTEENLEGYDSTTVQQSQGTVDLHFETDNDYDATTIDVTPGAILRVEAYLDGQSQPRFVYWVGDGVLHEGAPTNPVDLSPSKP